MSKKPHVLKTCLEDIWKTCLEDVLKTYFEHVFKTSCRETKRLLGIPVSNINAYLTNLYFSSLYLTKQIQRQIQNTLLEPNNFNICLILIKQYLYFDN